MTTTLGVPPSTSACYRCTAPAERTCERCLRPMCRGCAQVWPMYAVAVKMGVGTCKVCHLAGVQRSLDEARRLLLAAGIEPEF